MVRRAYLVNLIEENDRIGDPGITQRLDEFARHGADISAAMALDFRFVAHTTDAEAKKLATQGVGDGMPNRRFAHTGRPDQ